MGWRAWPGLWELAWGRPGGTVGSQPGRVSPSFAQLLNPHVVYVLPSPCFPCLNTEGCTPEWDLKKCK